MEELTNEYPDKPPGIDEDMKMNPIGSARFCCLGLEESVYSNFAARC